MKLSELIPLRGAIEKMATKEYELATALEFAKFTRGIIENIQAFDVARTNLLNEMGTKKEDGSFQIKPEFEAEFKKKIQEILNKEVEIEPLQVAKVKMNVAPADLINIIHLFK